MSGILAIIGFTIAGELVVASFSLPVPGAIVGLVLLLAALALAGRRRGEPPLAIAEIETSARTVLRFLPLFLVPLGVGVITLGGMDQADLARLVATLVLALVAAIVAVSTVLRLLAPRA